MRPASLALLLFAGSAAAWERNDPLDTRAKLPPAVFDSSACKQAVGDAPLTLADVVGVALCRHPQTRESYAAIEQQAAQLGVARGAYLPTLDASLGYSRNYQDDAQNSEFVTVRAGDYNQSSASLTLSYLLFDFGARSANRGRAQALLDAALASGDRAVQELLFSAVQAYYQVRATEAQLSAAREAETTSASSLDASTTRHEVGVSTPADVLQARTAHSQAVLTRIRAQGDLRIAQGQLANVMALDASQTIRLAAGSDSVPTAGLAVQAGSLIEAARRRRPDLLAAAAQQQAAQADIAAARASGRPSFRFDATGTETHFGGFGNNTQSALGLNLNIPVFTGFTTTYRVRGAEAQLKTAQAQYDALHQQIALDVWTAYQQLQTAIQAVQSTGDLLASAKASQEAALGRYKAGVGSVLDLLNAQSALADARQQQVRAAFDLDLARTSLALALGVLDADLATAGLNMNELQPGPAP
ncbi:MAG: TolC family protein [Nevskiales bacterium]